MLQTNPLKMILVLENRFGQQIGEGGLNVPKGTKPGFSFV